MGAFKNYKEQAKGFQGEIEMTPTAGDHIAAEAKDITVRGIDYRVHGHFYKWADGEWHLGLPGDSPATTYYHQLSPTRRGGFDINKLHDVSSTARTKLAELLTAEVIRWVNENPQALIQAQQDDTTREIEKREKKIAELKAEVATLEAEVTSLRGQQ
jgi:hypothetical protein